MKTLLFLSQILTGMTSLGLLVWCAVRAYRGHPSKTLSKWTLGFAAAFVILTLAITGM